MEVLIVLSCITFLILLISLWKINAFLAFLIISLLGGLLLGMPAASVSASVQKGIGDMLGSLVIIVVGGAMLGKLVADSGAALRITDAMMGLFGLKRIQWGLMATGFVIGITMFYTVGFVLVIPLIFSVVYRYKLPAVYTGLPMIAALSVTHGFLPPHPSPTALVAQFHADMGTTLWYGVLIGIPTVILAGPVFTQSLKGLQKPMLKTFAKTEESNYQTPTVAQSALSSLLPVLLLSASSLLLLVTQPTGMTRSLISFFADPAVVMLLAVLYATWSLGVRLGRSIADVMSVYVDAVKDIGMILLIMGGAGALKQVLIDSGVSVTIAEGLARLPVHPLVLGWLIAAIIRVCVGSATVAGLTAAGIVLPLLEQSGADPNLMVLAIGAGSLMFSHVNDSGFWLFKEYFNLSIRETIRSWSLMETIVAFSGLAGVLLINALH
ncbi:MAG: gluconate:H+ symporter [Cyclobacteriaceae bacterium]|nr:gluconate:H+ symporter [Cyclobacteriaceae bacterium]